MVRVREVSIFGGFRFVFGFIFFIKGELVGEEE